MQGVTIRRVQTVADTRPQRDRSASFAAGSTATGDSVDSVISNLNTFRRSRQRKMSVWKSVLDTLKREDGDKNKWLCLSAAEALRCNYLRLPQSLVRELEV